MKKQTLAAIIGGTVLALGVAGAGVYLALNQNNFNDATSSTNTTSDIKNSTSGSENTASIKTKITSGGSYTFTGTLTDKISIDTSEAVTIILDNVTIKSSDGAGIKCKEGTNVEIKLVGTNTITADNENDGINSEGDLTITGDGALTINAVDDGIHADGMLTVESGTLKITAHEGLEATYIKINGGDITISATDDGINAGAKSDKYSVKIEINGGNLTISMGQGDTDAIDSNGDLVINGGTINITANSPFDWDGTGQLNGGTITVNGQAITQLTNQFGGGGMMGPNQAPNQNPDSEQPQMSESRQNRTRQ